MPCLPVCPFITMTCFPGLTLKARFPFWYAESSGGRGQEEVSSSAPARHQPQAVTKASEDNTFTGFAGKPVSVCSAVFFCTCHVVHADLGLVS